LYNNGARKLALFGVGQIGCSPNALAQNSPDGRTCVARINSANQLFNNGLRSLVDNFNNQFPDAKATYVNVYGIFQDIINNPSSFGNCFLLCLKTYAIFFRMKFTVMWCLIFRIQSYKCWVLWGRKEQWSNYMFALSTPMQEQEGIPVLGCISSNRVCKCYHCK